MASDPRREHVRELRKFLQVKWRSPDVGGEVIVRRNEVEEFARRVGMDEEEAWLMFRALKEHAWEGQYMPESHSEERRYTAARLTWVEPRPR